MHGSNGCKEKGGDGILAGLLEGINMAEEWLFHGIDIFGCKSPGNAHKYGGYNDPTDEATDANEHESPNRKRFVRGSSRRI
jgi:hypothetical protein